MITRYRVQQVGFFRPRQMLVLQIWRKGDPVDHNGYPRNGDLEYWHDARPEDLLETKAPVLQFNSSPLASAKISQTIKEPTPWK